MSGRDLTPKTAAADDDSPYSTSCVGNFSTGKQDMDNDVKEVRVSQSSRNDARGVPSRNEIEAAINDLNKEYDLLKAKKLAAEARLYEINNLIRGNRLPQEQYARLTKEQVSLVKEIAEIETAITGTKRRKHLLHQDTRLETKAQVMSETNVLLAKILRELEKLNGSHRQ